MCPTEIIQFSDAAERFKALNVNVAAASIDSLHTHLAWVQTPRSRGGLGKMNVPIISDVTKALSKSFGFLVEDAADDEAGVACRGTVIIGPNGVVRHISCNDLPVGRDVEEVLRLVAAFQYVDKHGEVCPAGWKAGAKAPALKADPKESKAYFAEVYKN